MNGTQLQLVPAPAGPPEVMNLKQAAAYMGVSADKMQRYLSSGVLPAFRMGNRWKVKRSLLDRWMEEQSAKPLAAKTRRRIHHRGTEAQRGTKEG